MTAPKTSLWPEYVAAQLYFIWQEFYELKHFVILQVLLKQGAVGDDSQWIFEAAN